MISRIDLRGRALSRRELLDELPRAEVDVEHAGEIVAPILADVRARGAAALRDLAERFDGVRPAHLRVPVATIARVVTSMRGPGMMPCSTACFSSTSAYAAPSGKADAVRHSATSAAKETNDAAKPSWPPVVSAASYAPGANDCGDAPADPSQAARIRSGPYRASSHMFQTDDP